VQYVQFINVEKENKVEHKSDFVYFLDLPVKARRLTVL
jgi:hypothetical protein